MNKCQFSNDENIHIGKMLHENSYRRDGVTSRLFGLKPDRVDWKNREIHEIKKSSSCIQAAEKQLIFYLCLMSAATQKIWKGYITEHPKKKKHRVELSVTNVSEALVSHKKIIEIKSLEEIPKVDKLKICCGCSNRGFCWGSV